MDRLKREGNPPVGQLASPIPQYKRPGSTDYEAVEGQHGAPFATLKDASGNVVSPATEEKLEQARVLLNTISTKDFATQTTLEAVLTELANVKSELEAIKANQISGDQKVQLSGTIVEPIFERIVNVQTDYGSHSYSRRYIAPSGQFTFSNEHIFDIAKYKQMGIYISNQTQGAILTSLSATVRGLRFSYTPTRVAVERMGLEDIPAGATLRMNGIDVSHWSTMSFCYTHVDPVEGTVSFQIVGVLA